MQTSTPPLKDAGPQFHSVHVVTAERPLDDVFNLFSDVESTLFPSPLGDPPDAVVDPDEDLKEAKPRTIKVNAPRTLGDLEPLTVLYILHGLFDREEDWWSWPVELVIDLVDDEYSLSRVDVHIIGALHTLLSADAFWIDAAIFNVTCQALDGRVPSVSLLPQLYPHEMMRAIDVGETVKRLKGGGIPFSQHIEVYVALFCLERNLWALPEPLGFAQDDVLTILRRRGWGEPPMAQVQSLVKDNFSGTPSTEAEVQALTILELKQLRSEWAKKATQEIRRFKTSRENR